MTPLTLLLTALLLGAAPVWAVHWVWDGEVTTGKSGVERNVEDDRDSTSKAFHEEKNIIVWPLPIDRYFEDVDPEADADNPTSRTHRSPYAAVVIPRDWGYRGQRMTKGVYLVKLGAFNAGSLKTHQVWQPLPPSAPASLKDLPARLKASRRPPDPATLTLVLSRQGRVVAVLPVSQITRLNRQQRKNPSDKGWVDYVNDSGHVAIRGKRYQYTAQLL
jgi:hypothetical protein